MKTGLYMGPMAEMVVWSEGGEGVVLFEPYIGAKCETVVCCVSRGGEVGLRIRLV